MNKILFSNDKDIIKRTIVDAEEFIYIVSFQFTDVLFIKDLLSNKEKEIDVQIITSPVDSYKKQNERKVISDLFKELETLGVSIHQCFWEVGDPSLTTTSQSGDQAEGGGNKWYSMHGKFIVTEKNSLALSANFDDKDDIEIYLLSSDPKIISQFKEKFYFLKHLFIDNDDYPGKIFGLLNSSLQESIRDFHKKTGGYRLSGYPPELSPSNTISNGLFITPFDGKARFFLNSLIENATSFLYLSTERLYEDEIVNRLITKSTNPNIKIKLITCPPSQIRQNPYKAEQMIFDLLSSGIEIRLFNNIHAKTWISDEIIGIGSINLGKMNLGFYKQAGIWRANTETIFFNDDKELIAEGRDKFERLFNSGEDAFTKISLSTNNITRAKDLLSYYGLKSDSEARATLSLIQSDFKIKAKRNFIDVIRTSVKIAGKFNVKFISKTEIIMSLILFYLSERKNSLDELNEKIQPLLAKSDQLQSVLTTLLNKNIIVKIEEFYKININAFL